jgi:hypothetical protein
MRDHMTGARLTDAERTEIERLFGYVPEPEPLDQMLAAVEQIKAAAFEAGRRAGAEQALAEAERRIEARQKPVGWVDGNRPGMANALLILAALRAEGTHEGSE